ncbi:hypothetical protein QO009_003084 [Brevibacillus aydinogluensis]|jgi:hypothetical protein|nr:hypothetical protein [Brevibacillus aydinogluensis]
MVLYKSVIQLQKLLSKRFLLIQQLRHCDCNEVEKYREQINKVEEQLTRLGAAFQ